LSVPKQENDSNNFKDEDKKEFCFVSEEVG